MKSPPAGLTGAVRALQWTIQDLNGSVENLGQSHDHLRRAQNIVSWAAGIFAALLLSALVWVANDVFHLKDQLTRAERRFDSLDTNIAAIGSRLDELTLGLQQGGIAALPSAPLASAPQLGVVPAPAPARRTRRWRW